MLDINMDKFFTGLSFCVLGMVLLLIRNKIRSNPKISKKTFATMVVAFISALILSCALLLSLFVCGCAESKVYTKDKYTGHDCKELSKVFYKLIKDDEEEKRGRVKDGIKLLGYEIHITQFDCIGKNKAVITTEVYYKKLDLETSKVDCAYTAFGGIIEYNGGDDIPFEEKWEEQDLNIDCGRVL